jgi:glycosyltransferase involved in cell wall biosynthesis
MKEFSLTIPAKNERTQISKTLDNYIKILESSFKNKYEIIVVCNNCTDDTPEIVQKYISKNKTKSIKLLNIKKSAGKGEAILKGWEKAHSKYIGFVDSDDAFDHADIKIMLNLLKKSECVIASKWKNNNFQRINEPALKKIFAIGWNSLSRILFGLKFKDTQAGAKFLKKKIYDKINKNFICKGFDFDVELLYKLKKQKCKIEEVHTKTKPGEFSTFQIKYIPKMFLNLIKLRLKK